MLTPVYYGQQQIFALNLFRDEFEADALEANEVGSVWGNIQPHCTVDPFLVKWITFKKMHKPEKIFIFDFFYLKFVYYVFHVVNYLINMQYLR